MAATVGYASANLRILAVSATSGVAAMMDNPMSDLADRIYCPVYSSPREDVVCDNIVCCALSDHGLCSNV